MIWENVPHVEAIFRGMLTYAFIVVRQSSINLLGKNTRVHIAVDQEELQNFRNL